MAERLLLGLHYSPWTERARWALDHHRLDYRYQEHTPLIGEAALRVRLHKPRGRVSVPVLFTPHGAVQGSLAIARFADRIGRAAPLVPPALEGDVEAWTARCDDGANAGRGLVTRAMASSRAALREALPPLVPERLRDLLAPTSGLAVAFVRRKYDAEGRTDDADEATLGAVLGQIRAALDRGDGCLLGGFGFADIAAATLLQMVRPVGAPYIVLGPGFTAAWTRERLAARFADLLAWRDGIYARHRRPGAEPADDRRERATE